MGNPKSKEAKKKIRRWSFLVKFEHEDGRKNEIEDTRLTYGNQQDANNVAVEIRDEYSSDERAKDWFIKVEPVAHETIAYETFKQLRGLEIDISIQRNVALEACSRWCKGENPPALTEQESYVQLWLAVSARMKAEARGEDATIELATPEELPIVENTDKKVDLAELQKLAYGEAETEQEKSPGV